MNEKRNRRKKWLSEKDLKMSNNCPIFVVYKNEWNCLLDDCKYFVNNKCDYNAVRKIVYDKLVMDRLKASKNIKAGYVGRQKKHVT